MSDFGANIFGPEQPSGPRRPPHHRDRERPSENARQDAQRTPAHPQPEPPPTRPGHHHPPRPDREPRLAAPSGGAPARHTGEHRPSGAQRPARAPEHPRPHGHGGEHRHGDARRPAAFAAIVDVGALADEARALGGEPAWRRLCNGLGGERTIVRTVALVRPGTTPPGTFDPVPATGDFAGGITLATTALSLLAEGHGLILAPANPPMRDLAHALRRAGHTVELAGFAAPAGTSVPVRRLGRDCLFVP